MNSKIIARYLVNSLLILFTIHCSLFTLSSCGTGDDDGRRLGDVIVGTWQRGYGPGDVIIEGDTELEPENLTYDQFIFHGDGSYNGMKREGTFLALDDRGEVIYEGDFLCDNDNLKLIFDDEGKKQTILAQVLAFTDDTIRLTWQNESVIVTLIIRKKV